MPRCKICKDKFEAKYFLQKTCFNASCVLEWKDKVVQKEWRKRKATLKPLVYTKEYKGYLQDEINKLVRLIDSHFKYKCIDCEREYGKQTDAAHYTSVGANSTLRYNLHNIHSSRSDCNFYSNTHLIGYEEGIKKRYSEQYFRYIKEDLKVDYKLLKLTPEEVNEALKNTRKCIREFNFLIEGLKDGKEARTFFNEKIGIY